MPFFLFLFFSWKKSSNIYFDLYEYNNCNYMSKIFYSGKTQKRAGALGPKTLVSAHKSSFPTN